MEQVGKLFGAALRKLKKPEAPLAWLVGAWPALVGKDLAARTRPAGFGAGRLEIATDGKDWQAQLESMSEAFCERINKEWGGTLVREVRFVRAQGPGKRPPREADNEHTPFVRTRSGKSKKAS